jgi:hypothetical protein
VTNAIRLNLIFLDVDGVLNDHTRFPNGYCGIQWDKVQRLDWILSEVPDAQLVLSSSWRYPVHRGEMNLYGLEGMLLAYGLDCYGRIHGITCRDEDVWGEGLSFEEMAQRGAQCRSEQIRRYVEEHRPDAWVVLDDLYLPGLGIHLVRTDEAKGMTHRDAAVAIGLLQHAFKSLPDAAGTTPGRTSETPRLEEKLPGGEAKA